MSLSFHHRAALVVLAAFVSATAASAAKVAADVLPPEPRHATVVRAEKLARPPVPAAVPADLKSPFAPPGFDKPDTPAETRPDARGGDTKTPSAPAAPATDRDLLEAVANKIPTSGTIFLGGRPLLISGTNRIEVGSRFTVVYNGQEYELELTAIDRTTFTVRYKGEEFTRPIRLGRSP